MCNNKSFLRIVVAFAIYLAGIMMFSGCKKEKVELPEIKPPIETGFTLECGISEINTEEYLKMCAVPDRVPLNSYFKVVIENHTKNNFVWGENYCLEYFNETIWEPIELDIMFTYIGYILKSEETAEQKIFLDSKDIQSTGKYRIHKPASPCGPSPYDLYAEFEVIEGR